MTITQNRKDIIGKMIAAVMREKFFRLARKYGPETTFQVWVDYVKKRGEIAQALEGHWHLDMSLVEVIEILDECTNPIEQLILNLLAEERKKQE